MFYMSTLIEDECVRFYAEHIRTSVDRGGRAQADRPLDHWMWCFFQMDKKVKNAEMGHQIQAK